MKRYVVDSSVVVKWVASAEERDVDQALRLLDELEKRGCELIISEYVYYEVGNVLYWGKNLEEEVYHQTMQTILSIPCIVYPLDEHILSLVYPLMHRYKISLYDAVPAAIAQQERCPLVSADAMHHKQLPEVILLSEFSQ